jgi:hypothetical protein
MVNSWMLHVPENKNGYSNVVRKTHIYVRTSCKRKKPHDMQPLTEYEKKSSSFLALENSTLVYPVDVKAFF